MKIRDKGIIYLTIVVIESALVPIGLYIGGIAIGVIPLLFYTSLVATVTLALYSYLQDRLRGFFHILRTKGIFAPMLVAGLLGFGVTQLLQNFGTIYTNPSISAVVWRTWIIILAALTPLMLRQNVTKRQYASLLLGFLSVYIIASNGALITISTTQLPAIAMLLCSGLAVAVSTLMLKRYNVSTTGFVLLASIATLAFSLLLMLMYGRGASLALSAKTILVIMFLGIVDAGLGSAFYYHSFKTLNTQFVGNALLSIPFITILFSVPLTGTVIKWYYVLAALILALAIFLGSSEAAVAPKHINSEAKAPEREGLWIFDITAAFAEDSDTTVRMAAQGIARALAIRLPQGSSYDANLHGSIFDKYGCMAFTTFSPHSEVRDSEIEYIREMMELRGQEDALVCIGDPEDAEKAFEEFTTVSREDILPKVE